MSLDLRFQFTKISVRKFLINTVLYEPNNIINEKKKKL